jgi:hypothetical protein
MPHNSIERWEWEGGALSVEADVPRETRPAEVPRRPAEASANAESANRWNTYRDRVGRAETRLDLDSPPT